MLAASCRDRPPTEGRISLIPSQAPEVLTPERLYSLVPRFDWDFRPEVPAAARRAFAAGLEHRPGQGLALHGPSDITWPVSLDASQLDALHVTLQYPHGADAELFWKRPGEDFDPARRLRQRRGDGVAGLGRTLTFELFSHPGWSGRIAELRLQFGLGADETRIVEQLRGLAYRLAPETVREMTERPWLVDLGSESRIALLSPPASTIERRFTLAGEAVLHFAYGVTAGACERVDFRISQISQEGTPQPLFEASLRPETPRRWREGRVAVAGEGPVRLVLETSTEGPSRAMPLWANLDLVPAPSRDPRPNVVLISVDTLRADHLPFYGYAGQTAPHLTRWARRFGVIFEDAVVQAPWTLPSHTSLFTGLDATRHGVNHTHTPVPSRLHLLAERLRDAGYSTAAVTGGGFLHAKYGFAQGFERFRYWPTLGEPENELETGVDRCADLLATLPRPFFLFLHTFDVHDYLIYRRAAGAEDSVAAWYDQRIRHTDVQLGRLLDRLEVLGLRGETAIVFTSDHGEALGDKGPRGHGFLSEDNLRVPLVVELPDGRGAGSRIARQVRSVDLAPTLLELAGLPAPGEIDGRSLLPLLADETAGFPDLASSYAAKRNLGLALRRAGSWKYVFPNTAWSTERGADRLYDLRQPAGESEALAQDHPRLEPWRELARRQLASLPGIRLDFANATARPLYFRLRSRMLSDEGVKAAELPCSCVRREQAFQTLVETPPWTRFEIQLEEVIDDPLEIAAWAGEENGTVEIRESVRLEASPTPWVLRFDGGRWRLERSGGPAAESGLTVRWQSGLDRPAASPIEADPDLRRRLRALGYLDD